MPVPDFQMFFLPLLRLVAEAGPVSPSAAKEQIAKRMNLTSDDLAQRLPSGASVFGNRVGWARTYLKKAALIESPSRGIWQVTQRGRDVIGTNPSRLDVKFLKQYPEFVEFHTASPQQSDGAPMTTPSDATVTPVEALIQSHTQLQVELASELLERIKEASPAFFERLVIEVLVKMGYGGTLEDAGRAVGGSGDGGIDGIIKEDRLGLDNIYIQAKRWEGTVGRPEIQKFAGALQGHRARKGVFITTGAFSKDADEYVSRIDSRIVLIDGATLSKLMIEHDVGVNTVQVMKIKKADSDFFIEE